MKSRMNVETFGKRIYRLRKAANMTQRDLANKLGISEPAVCKWETDSSMPDIMLLAPLAKALHTNLNILFSYKEKLSSEKAKELAHKADEIAATEGTDTGIRYWKECLQEYPNSELLMMAYVKWLMRQLRRLLSSFSLNVRRMLCNLCGKYDTCGGRIEGVPLLG